MGARGHVASVVKPAELVAVIRQVADGEDPLKDEVIGRPDLIDKIMEGFRELSAVRICRQSELTPRELDVLEACRPGHAQSPDRGDPLHRRADREEPPAERDA